MYYQIENILNDDTLRFLIAKGGPVYGSNELRQRLGKIMDDNKITKTKLDEYLNVSSEMECCEVNKENDKIVENIEEDDDDDEYNWDEIEDTEEEKLLVNKIEDKSGLKKVSDFPMGMDKTEEKQPIGMSDDEEDW